MVDTNFYRAFEDRHRGSRELIKSRLAVYLPFTLPLKQIDDACQGIDLGCGRGEWLELMQENEINVQGIDLDQGMLEAARERGLSAKHGDAIKSLQALAAESQNLVSGFHIAEHIPFERLQILIQESLRVLKPGGLLILETPNPENIIVGTANFYLDPTHQRPIPMQLLSFMAEFAGFEKVKILRLQQSPELINNNSLRLLDVLSGVSPDYSVVAQKAGAPEIIAITAQAFDTEYGLSLELLASRYSLQAEAKAQQAEATAQQAEAKAQQAEAKAQQVEATAQQAEAKAQQAEAKAQQAEATAQQAEATAQQAEAKAQQAEATAQQAEARIQSLLNSTSWRITAPMRRIVALAQHASRKFHNRKAPLSQTVKIKLFNTIKVLSAHAKLYIVRRPALLRLTLAVLARFPAIKNKLKHAKQTPGVQPAVASELANLSPQARIVRRHSTLAQVYLVSSAKLRRFIRMRTLLISMAKSMLKWAGEGAQRSPRFKRFVMRLLRGHPALSQKLRKIYLESRHKEQPQPANWSGTPTASITPISVVVSDDRECVIQLSPCGMNAHQRTPLETHANSYCEPR